MSSTTSPFGDLLRHWRRTRGLSQLGLSAEVRTSSRHLSFLETGRSRPGRELILRIADCLDIPVRERNRLLSAAGFAAAYPESSLDEEGLRTFRSNIAALLEGHDPFPGSAVDARGKIHMANQAFLRFAPNADELSAEEIIDNYYGRTGPSQVENWSEVGWALVERRRQQARETGDPDLFALAERAAAHLADVPRPKRDPAGAPPPVVCARVRLDGQLLSTYSAVLRFETALDVTLAELRLELIFPADEETAEFFRRDAATPS